MTIGDELRHNAGVVDLRTASMMPTRVIVQPSDRSVADPYLPLNLGAGTNQDDA